MTLEQRVAKLERQNRRLRRGGAVLLAVAAFVVLIAQGSDKELPDLVVRSISVTDPDGRTCAKLGPLGLTLLEGSRRATSCETRDGGCLR
jgi:hypothetical protein